MRVALVHDYLNQYGGAERVLEVFMEMFPEAPIYTLFYDRQATLGRFEGRKIITSFLNFIPGAKKHHRAFFPFMPLAMRTMTISNDYDLVISISASFAKGIKTPAGVKHLCYLLTPTRFLWDEAEQRVAEEVPALARPLARWVIKKLRKWDWQAAQQPDFIVPISEHIKKEIQEKYGRATLPVIYPPHETGKVAISRGKYFVIVSRLIPYKKIDIAIQACERLGKKLKIIGGGRDLARLKRLAGKNTEFLGWVGDEERNAILAGAEAFLMPQVEDFGIAAVEAQALGVPVIAYATGGALEIVKSGETGLFFNQQTPESLVEAIDRFESARFNRAVIARHAQRFSKDRFKKEILDIIRLSMVQ